MHLVTTITYRLDEAKQRFEGTIDLTRPEEDPPAGRLAGVEVELPSPYKSDKMPVPTLVVWFPGWSRKQVRDLLSQEVSGVHLATQDRSYVDVCILFGPEQGGLYIAMGLDMFYFLTEERRTLRVLAVGDDFVVDARHVYTEEDLDAYWDSMPPCLNTGPDFDAHSYFTAEERESTAHLPSSFKPPGPMVIFLNGEAARKVRKA